MAFFERLDVRLTIFGSFFVIFVPLVSLMLWPNFVAAVPYLVLAELVGLGVTHFFITLALYFQRDNLRYFGSSRRRTLLYFVAPAAVLLFFALSAAAGLRENHPVFALYFFGAIRFFDFFHVGRQSFGILQIFKRPVASQLPPWSRRAENAFFVGMAALQWETFVLGGRFASDALYARLPAIALGALFVMIAGSYLGLPAHDGEDSKRQAGRRRGLLPVGYFAMQACCAAAAVYDTRLYGVGLTLHYVEYHAIMAPRCLQAPLDTERSRLDRGYAAVSRRPLLFYALLLAVVMLFELRNHVGLNAGPSTTFFIHLFDGIFFVHYLIEAFLWKFGEPHFRDTLLPLYASPRPDAPPLRSAHLLTPPALALITVAALALALPAGARDAFERRVIHRMDADNHLRWGIELLERDALERAEPHLQRAMERNPGSEAARSALAQLHQRKARAMGEGRP
ncbi:MAG: hypothetical protein OEZ06_04775 [Myxococcales bacterium]|nr:hypothetical protein [Myxococcales bacterium]